MYMYIYMISKQTYLLPPFCKFHSILAPFRKRPHQHKL